MLTLLLLRHAKAEPQGLGDDFDRALTKKGEADARALGIHMAELKIVPDLALVSAAARTLQTFDLYRQGADRAIPARVDDELYNATDSQMRDLLKAVDSDVKTLLIVGHNPGIMDLAARLARDGDVRDLGRLREHFPPCSLALVSFDREGWRDARVSGGRLDLLLMPEDYAVQG
jgi:phosphohistidine phosphatase